MDEVRGREPWRKPGQPSCPESQGFGDDFPSIFLNSTGAEGSDLTPAYSLPQITEGFPNSDPTRLSRAALLRLRSPR